MITFDKILIALTCIAGTISAENAERVITLRQGQIYRISLETTPGTGYQWVTKPLSLNAPIEIVQQGTDKPRKMMPGAPTKQYWVIKALKPIGKRNHADLTLEYKRSWEHGVRPSKVETYTFYVQ